MSELPADLSGLQCLADDAIIRTGDIAVSAGQAKFFIPTIDAGRTAGGMRATLGVSVYRRIPVAKQGDLDHKNFAPKPLMPLPTEAAERKKRPICSGVLDYFPDAIAAVAECSWAGNAQHHPGTPLHWDKSKSADEADALVRHLIQRGTKDTDGIPHSAKVAWRALALLQRELETGK